MKNYIEDCLHKRDQIPMISIRQVLVIKRGQLFGVVSMEALQP